MEKYLWTVLTIYFVATWIIIWIMMFSTHSQLNQIQDHLNKVHPIVETMKK